MVILVKTGPTAMKGSSEQAEYSRVVRIPKNMEDLCYCIPWQTFRLDERTAQSW